MTETSGSWAVPDDRKTPDLLPLLGYARDHYRGHIDWFLRHKEAGIRTLGSILTAQVGVVGLFFAGRFNRWVTLGALALTTLLAFPLTRLAVLSCTKAFRAALEHALLLTKILWAMGLTDAVSVQRTLLGSCPAAEDRTLFPPRYLADARCFETTDRFVEHNLRKRDTTLHATRQTLFIMGGAAVVMGLGAIAAVLLVILQG